MNKVLYITEPDFKPYPITASVLSILGKYDNSMLWYFENATNYFSRIDCGYTDFFSEPLRKNPFLEWQCISRKWLQRYNIDLITFLTDAINDDYYIFVGLDHYYISASKAYKAYNFMHDVLIYGYDDNTRQFNAADFFTHEYTYKKVPFSEIEDSYRFASYEDRFDIPCQSNIYLIKTRSVDSYRFNLKKVIYRLTDYKDSTNNYDEFFHIDYVENPDEYVFGLNVYDNFIGHLSKENSHCDIRQLYMIFSHKYVIKLLLEYLKDSIQDSTLFSDIENLVQKSRQLINLGLKFNLSKNDNIRNRIINRLWEMKETEYLFLCKLLHNLESL